MDVDIDRSRREVVIRMAPEDARALAEFLHGSLPTHDVARMDADQLLDAVARLDLPLYGRDEEPTEVRHSGAGDG